MTAPSITHARLLLVDDDEEACRLLAEVLEREAYDVVPAHVRGRLQAVRRTVAELGSGLAPLFGGYLANTFNPGVPFLFYAPLLAVSATLLAVVGKETLER